MHRSRGWMLYALTWLPVAIAYAQVLSTMKSMSLSHAMLSAASYVVGAALLGVGVWHASGRFAWPDKQFGRFILLQLTLAIAYSMLWYVSIVGYMSLRLGIESAFVAGKSFSGWQLFSGLWVYGVIAAVSYALRITVRLREREAAAGRADALRMHAELQVLRGRLNPHFLYNTLHTVSELVHQDPETVQLALERFSDLLRYVVDAKRLEVEDVSLGEELAFVRDYLALEQLRLGDRLSVVEQIDPEARECLLPSLTLQPLVENAINHAIASRTSQGTITIAASVDGDELTLVVADDGPGALDEEVRFARGSGLRVGRQRLETRYPNRSRFTVTTARGAGFTVTLALPAEVSSVVPRRVVTMV